MIAENKVAALQRQDHFVRERGTLPVDLGSNPFSELVIARV